MKPPRVIVNDLNRNEMLLFKGRRRFETWRDMGHYFFDKLWRDINILDRNEAYEWLGNKLKLEGSKSHFRNMNMEQCKEAVYYCQQLLNDNRRLDLDLGIKPTTPFYIYFN